MYPSDYGYASSGCRGGEQTLILYDNEICIKTNWLFKSKYEWLLGSRPNYQYYIRYIRSDGYVGNYAAFTTNVYVFPTTYLTSEVKITSGNGTIENPYNLSL